MQRFFERVLIRGSLWSTLVIFVLAAIGLYLGQGLKLKLSLTDLLPENHPSVIKFDKITEIVGGVGFLIVILHADDGVSHVRAVHPIIDELRKQPGVRSAFYDREEYFFSSRMLYYLELKDLKKLEDTVRKTIRKSRTRVLDLGLWDEEGSGKNVEELDPRVKETAHKAADVLPDLISREGKDILLMIKPDFDSTDLQRTTKLVETTKRVLETHLPAEVRFDFVGRYYDKIADSKIIQEDISILGILSIVTIGLLLLYSVRSVRTVAFLFIPVFMGIGFTLAAAALGIGHINIITGFLLGILTGLGADYGIHLVYRLRLEQSQPSDGNPNPVWRTLRHSGHSVFVGASAAALAFFTLCYSDFRAFSEFGFICGTGMIAVVVALLLSFSFLVRLLRIDRIAPKAATSEKRFRFPQLETRRSLVIGLVVSAVVAAFGLRVGFEYDFRKMMMHSAKVQELTALVDEIYGRSVTPSVLAVPSREMAIDVENFLKKHYVPNTLETIVSGATVVPDQQLEKERILHRIKAQIDPLKDNWLEKELDVPASSIRRWVTAKPFTFEELPTHLQDFLRGKNHSYYLLYIYPTLAVDVSTLQGVRTFSAMIRDLEKNFPEVLAGSDAVVFNEILDLIKNDGFKILAGILIMVALMIWVNLRDLEATISSFVPLILAFPMGMGLMALFDVQFNIFNISIIPSFVAIGIDVPIHITHRAKEVRSGFQAARDLAGPINLTLLTQAIGFGVLIFSRAGVLRSLGWLAFLGTVAIWWMGLFILPAFLEWGYRRKASGKHSLGGHSELQPALATEEPEMKTISP